MGVHTPILTDEVLHGLRLRVGDTVVDGTVNRGGHAVLLAQAIGPDGVLVGIDRDRTALEEARERLKDAPCRVELIEGNYRHVDTHLANLGIATAHGVLLDLGLSSDQLTGSGRGFSFQADEPLIMTFEADPVGDATTASVIVNEWSEESLRDIIRGFGEERYAGRIARAIVEARSKGPITRTGQLKDTIAQAVPGHYRHGRIDPATRTFQAIRIATNDEYGAIREGLLASVGILEKGGRIAVISFHSGEDRIVKKCFREQASEGKIAIVTRRPITPTDEEITRNPRSRSAKLRIAERL